ncbi:hypothetical protein BDV95DRAFT_378 [Massariosphaeria phaeospora]|uniref:Uncharacterized protein n=1 Tax=Massariosphaeria phaeospora TaxID=100035 RepID=A0A7C8MG96_9PLEO|nr:hypothetical protein BDV95DRAFT_378 [Massariosphaeria phaeospora]
MQTLDAMETRRRGARWMRRPGALYISLAGLFTLFGATDPQSKPYQVICRQDSRPRSRTGHGGCVTLSLINLYVAAGIHGYFRHMWCSSGGQTGRGRIYF